MEIKSRDIGGGNGVTYSLIVFDRERKLLGIGVVSGSIAVGSRVPWARAGVGGVVTQGYTNPSLGPRILDLLEEGYSCRDALYKALESDPEPCLRQVAVLKWGGVDKEFYCGEGLPEEYSGYASGYCIAVANLVVSKDIPRILCETYNTVYNTRHNIVEAIIEALYRAHLLGGDKRGDHSSALLVVGETLYGKTYDKIIDLRIDYSEDPIEELRRLYNMVKTI